MNGGRPTVAPLTQAQLLARLTGAATLAAGALLYGVGTSQPATLAIGTAGQVLTVNPGATAPQWSSSLSLTGTIAAKPAATAGIQIDPNAATGNFTLSLSPANLTAARRWSFPDASDTVAGLAQVQTFTAAQTIAAALNVTGVVSLTGASAALVKNQSGSVTSFTVTNGNAAASSLAAYYFNSDTVNGGFWATSSGESFYPASSVVFGTISARNIAFLTGNGVKATLDNNGNFGIGVLPTANKGLLQIGNGSTTISSGAISWGPATAPDIFLYRIGVTTLCISDAAGTAALNIRVNNSPYVVFGTANAGASLILQSGNATTFLIGDGSQNALFAGQLITNNNANPTANTFAGNKIFGCNNGTAASAGTVGEYLRSVVSTLTNLTTSATWQQMTSLSLTAGEWDIYAICTLSSNNATSGGAFAISTTTASSAGTTNGETLIYINSFAGATTQSEMMVASVSVVGTTTYYLNAQATWSVGQPQFMAAFRAVRRR